MQLLGGGSGLEPSLGEFSDWEAVYWQNPQIRKAFGSHGNLSDHLCICDKVPSLVHSHNTVSNLPWLNLVIGFSIFHIVYHRK